MRRRSCRLRCHVASWMSTPGLPGRPSVVAPGLDGVRQAAGGGPGDAGRDGAARGPVDAQLPAAPADLLVPGARATQPLVGLAVGPTAALLGLANCRGARLLLLQPPPAPSEEIAERNAFIAAHLAAYSPPCLTSPSTAATPRRSPAPRPASRPTSAASISGWIGKHTKEEGKGGPVAQCCCGSVFLDPGRDRRVREARFRWNRPKNHMAMGGAAGIGDAER